MRSASTCTTFVNTNAESEEERGQSQDENWSTNTTQTCHNSQERGHHQNVRQVIPTPPNPTFPPAERLPPDSNAANEQGRSAFGKDRGKHHMHTSFKPTIQPSLRQTNKQRPNGKAAIDNDENWDPQNPRFKGRSPTTPATSYEQAQSAMPPPTSQEPHPAEHEGDLSSHRANEARPSTHPASTLSRGCLDQSSSLP